MGIETRELGKQFGAVRVLEDVNLSVENGELVALLGPSGSGKTTLLRIIAGLEYADSGSVFYDRQEVTDLPAHQRRAGFVFQHYALFQHMNVAENIAFGLRVRPRRSRPPKVEIQRRVTDLLGKVQLQGYGGRFPAQLSGGQRQRIALARALAVEPRVLLLDEPFGALDAKVRREMRRWLRAFHDQTKVTTLFVTHDQEEAFSLADRIVLLNEGRVQQIGTPAEIREQPANRFVEEFLEISDANVHEESNHERRPFGEGVPNGHSDESLRVACPACEAVRYGSPFFQK